MLVMTGHTLIVGLLVGTCGGALTITLQSQKMEELYNRKARDTQPMKLYCTLDYIEGV